MNNFSKENFLKSASGFNSTNPNDRNQAYQFMEQFIKNQPQLFTEYSISCLKDESLNIKDETMRIILTLLIRALKNGPQDNSGRSVWLDIEKTTQEQLLACSFQVVLHSSQKIMQQGADLISTIFCLDRIHNKIWPNIIQSISNNVLHESQNVREAAIYSLSYICEYTHDKSEIILSDPEIEDLLTGIFNSLKQFDQSTLVGIDALKYATDFVVQRMLINDNFQTADFVFNILIELLIKSKNVNDPKLIIGTISCLKDICEGFFQNLQNYKDIIFDKVMDCLCLDPQIVNTVFFFFQGILEMERIEKVIYTDKVYQQIQKSVFQFLIEYKQLHENDEGGSSLTEACCQLLENINELYIEQTYQDSINFVYTNIEIQTVQNSCAALIVLRSLIKYTDTNIIDEPLQTGFYSFLSLLDSQQPEIVTQTLLLFREISKNFQGNVLYIDSQCKQILSAIENILKKQDDYSDKDYALALQILTFMTENIENYPESVTRAFQNQLKYCMEFIGTIVFQSNDCFIIDACFTFFFSVVQVCKKQNHVIGFFNNFKNMLYQVVKNPQSGSERDQQIICDIQIILNMILTKLVEQPFPFDQPQNQQNYNALLNSIQQDCVELYEICQVQITDCREILTEPFELMCTILLCYPDCPEFIIEVKKFTRNYVLETINMVDQYELFYRGINYYLKIINKYQLQGDSQFEQIFSNLLNLLQTEYNINKGDKFLNLLRTFNDFVGQSAELLTQYFTTICNLQKNWMKEIVLKRLQQFKSRDVGFLNEVTFTICEQFTFIQYFMQGNNNLRNQQRQEFQNLAVIYKDFFVEYIKVIKTPGKELAQQMLGCIADYKSLFNQEPEFNQELIKFLIIYLRQYTQQDNQINDLFLYVENAFGIRVDDII